MSSNELIDAQFDRAVEIVQGLPKTGPIQTDYEEKLVMYSLYKQATIGNVESPRPGIWDMLGRAKWDAWAKHKDLNSYEAKWLYVDALLKVLRKYSDKTMARSLVEELESYGGDPNNLVLSESISKSADSDTDSSTSSDYRPSAGASIRRSLQPEYAELQPITRHEDESNGEEMNEVGELPAPIQLNQDSLQTARPGSSMSSHRYRTPLAGSAVMSPGPAASLQQQQHAPTLIQTSGIPQEQPHPGFETPSAFADPSTTTIPTSMFPTGSSYVGQFTESSRGAVSPPANIYPVQHRHPYAPSYGSVATAPTLEHAVQHVQAQIAAISERLESLESVTRFPSHSNVSSFPGINRHTPPWAHSSGHHHHHRDGGEYEEWDLDDLGMWSMLANPISRGIDWLRDAAKFFKKDDQRSPSSVILRRLCLDASFLITALALVRWIWRRSGVRRREVYAALIVLWRAILGTSPPTRHTKRMLVDRGV